MSRAYRRPGEKQAHRDVGVRRWRRAKARPVASCVLSTVRRIPRNQLRAGAVVWARIPFEEIDDAKVRPAVVVQSSRFDVTVMPATTSPRRRSFPDLYTELTDPAAAGLRRRTGVRRRGMTIDRTDVLAVVGRLCEVDAAGVLGSDARSAGPPAQPRVQSRRDPARRRGRTQQLGDRSCLPTRVVPPAA